MGGDARDVGGAHDAGGVRDAGGARDVRGVEVRGDGARDADAPDVVVHDGGAHGDGVRGGDVPRRALALGVEDASN